MIKLSIIILSWNTKELLRRCLESVIREFRQKSSSAYTKYVIRNTEIIVVDNASKDGSAGMVKREFLQVKLITNRTNLGFSKGNNQGLKIANGEYIMLLNSDTIVKKGSLEKLVDFLDKNPQVAAVSPMLLNLDGAPQIDYYMKFPNLWQIFGYHNPVLRPLLMRLPFRRLIVNKASRKPFEADQLPGAALMARKEVWDKVGLLDEDYQFLFEDVDWCYRAKKKGCKLAVVPQAKVTHIGGASWKKRLKEPSNQFYRQFFSSMLLFVKKNYGFFKWQVFRVALIIHFLITFKPRLAFWFIVTPGKQEKLWR